MMLTGVLILAIGIFLGWCCGGWQEHKRWMDAICGREKVYRSDQESAK